MNKNIVGAWTFIITFVISAILWKIAGMDRYFNTEEWFVPLIWSVLTIILAIVAFKILTKDKTL